MEGIDCPDLLGNAAGARPGLVRLSVELEDVQDLAEDLVRAIGATEA